MQEDSEYQISLSALYGDGAQSEAVAVRYSTSESRVHRLGVRLRLRLRLRLWLSLGSELGFGLWLEHLRFHTQQPKPGEHLLQIQTPSGLLAASPDESGSAFRNLA